MQAQVDPSDYQAQATGTRQRLERQVRHVRRLSAAIRAISSGWHASRSDSDILAMITSAEGLVAEIESEVIA